MKNMQTPMTRAEFERNFYLLRERMRQGKFFVARGIPMTIEKIRYLPNGRIDLLTIDESARSQANMMSHFESEAFKAMIDDRGNKRDPTGSAPEHTGETPAT